MNYHLVLFLEKGRLLIETYPVGATLIALILFDIASGVAVAIGTKCISSSVSFRGMSKKAMELIIWGVAATIEPLTNGIPLGRLVACFYIFAESVSILENAAMLGVPIPAALLDTLTKLTAANKTTAAAPPPLAAPAVNVDVHSERTIVKATPTSDGPPASVTIQTLERKAP